jgi:hypothetical protein
MKKILVVLWLVLEVEGLALGLPWWGVVLGNLVIGSPILVALIRKRRADRKRAEEIWDRPVDPDTMYFVDDEGNRIP